MDRRAGTRTPRAWMKRALTAGTERKQESTVVGVHTDTELDVLRNLNASTWFDGEEST
jgi:hypothetical protein